MTTVRSVAADSGSSAGELVQIDRSGELRLHEQLEHSLRERIRRGQLPARTRLPSTRALAARLGVSRGVVTEAYGRLAAEGYLESRQGAPVRVTRAIRPTISRGIESAWAPSLPYHFHPGLPDLAGFPRSAWLRSVRSAWRAPAGGAIGYGDSQGTWQLRRVLADYSRRVRGAAADPELTLVCTGFKQGLSLVCRFLHNQGADRIAIEDPGWCSYRQIAERAGLRPTPIPVDHHGLQVSELACTNAAAVVVAPAHQFPTGAVLSRERRAALIEWAHRGERLIIEDDFDAEYRYDAVELGALQGLAPERVIYIGSTSKRLAPGIRLGWLLIPSHLVAELISIKAIEDGGAETAGQSALCHFIEQGELDRHIRRMRKRYHRRRKSLLQALQRWMPEARVNSEAAGLYDLVWLPENTDEPALIAAAKARGVGVEGLERHSFGHQHPGILLGFASLPEPAIESGMRLLASAHSEQSR